MDSLACVYCGGTVAVETSDRYPYTEYGLENVFISGVEIRTCWDCGEQSVLIPGIKNVHKEIAVALLNRDGDLTANEIRFICRHAQGRRIGWTEDGPVGLA